MALGRKTGGRKVGSKNKIKAPPAPTTLKGIAEQIAQEQGLEQQLQEQTPLEFLLEIMRDREMPPGVRIDCAGKLLPYMHAKKAEESTSDQVVHITEIRPVIVRAPEHPDRALQNEFRGHGDPAIPHSTMPGEPQSQPADPDWATDEPDAVVRARHRLDRMRGVN